VKRGLTACGAGALIWLASACEAPPIRSSIVIAEGTDVGVLLPVLETSALDAEINSQLYLGLNTARWGEGGLEYVVDDLCLTERWEFDQDSTTLKYFLRTDAVWSDGQPISANDVVFTYELLGNPEIASPYGDAWEYLDSVVAVTDHEVAFHFQRRYPGMLFHTGVRIIPAHVFEDAASDPSGLATHPTLVQPGKDLVVSGPYRIAERRPGDRLILEPNPNAFTARPKTDTIVFRIIQEETTRLVELKNGSVDVAGPLAMEYVEELEADPDFRIETISDRFYDYIAWNGSRFEPFSDPDVRLALSLAIDRQASIEGLGLAGYARPAVGPYPSIFQTLVDPSIQADPHLPDSSIAILAGRGWRDSDGDGVLDRDGQPFRFTLLTQAGNQRRESAAEIVQAQYADVGIDMEIRLVDFNTLLGLMFEERDFQAVLMGWQVGLEPDYLVGFFWPPDHPYNITGFSSAALDSLITLAQDAGTREEATPMWRAAASVITAEHPYAFLWFFDDAVAVSQRVTGTRIDTYGLYQNLYQWRLE
jgi:peptide/nickel transport system substrate-binding protein